MSLYGNVPDQRLGKGAADGAAERRAANGGAAEGRLRVLRGRDRKSVV